MTSILVWAGASFLLLLAAGVGAYLRHIRNTLREQVSAISTKFPEAVSTSAQGAAVTNLALGRITRAGGTRKQRTGQIYSVIASSGHLSLVRGREADIVAEFDGCQVRDVRVGTTSVLLADYTTLFFGIAAGGTTFELPIRINGPLPTSIMTASREWATDRGNTILEIVRAKPTGSVGHSVT